MGSNSQSVHGQKWPDGTTVGVYPAAAWPDPGQPPSGDVLATAVVEEGTAAFSGLDRKIPYVAWAGGVGVTFVIPDRSPTDSLRSRVEGLETSPTRTFNIGNGTRSDYANAALGGDIVTIGRGYFGETYLSLDGRPQFDQYIAKFFGATTADSAQCGSRGSFFVHLSQAHADEGEMVQAYPVTGMEGDAILQGRVRSTGLIVANSGIAQVQNSWGYSAKSEGRMVGFYSASGVARDAGTEALQHYGFLAEDARLNGNGTVVEAWSLYGKQKIQTETMLWLGIFLTGSRLAAPAASSATSLTVGAGHGTRFAGASVQIIIGDGPTAEVKTITSVAGDILNFSGLVNSHAAGEIVRPVQAANLRYSAGNLVTDMGFLCGSALPANLTIRFQNGTGYVQMPQQIPDTDAPAGGTGRLFVRPKTGSPVKSELCVRFTTGAVQVIAAEP